MKKRFVAVITTVCLMLSLLGGMMLPAGAAESAIPYARDLASNPEARTFQVAAMEDLNALSAAVYAGNTMEGYTFLQTADITMDATFTPIGESSTLFFGGTYDGQRYTISDLQLDLPERNGVGLFGYAKYATLKNIGVESGSVLGANRAGAIAGYADACLLLNCYNKADITIVSGTDGVGGIAGVSRTLNGTNAQIYGCFNMGTITCSTTAAGGISGWGSSGNTVEVHGCYNAGLLTHSGTLSTSSTAMDPICRNSNRTIGDFSDSYYLAGVCDDEYNTLNAVKLETADNVRMAYMLNHAQGYNNDAFTVDSTGDIVFASEESGSVMDFRLKVWQDGVVLSDSSFTYTVGSSYTVPATYSSVGVLEAVAGGKTYAIGEAIPAESTGELVVDLYLTGEYPSVTEIESNPDAAIFTVSSADELAKMAELVNQGNDFAGKTVYVTADLDFAGYRSWTPIGTITSSASGIAAEGSMPFSGTFDGQYHHFKNINFQMTGNYQALFSYVYGGAIRNIVLDEGSIQTDNKRGAVLVSLLSGSTVTNIENHVSIYSTGTASNLNLGLFALTINATVSSMVNYGNVGLADSVSVQENGGISGYGFNKTTINNVIVAGIVSGADSGAISRSSTVKNSYYLPSHEKAGTMTWDSFIGGEAAWMLNTVSGTAASAEVWSVGEDGPVLDPEQAAYRLTYVSTDSTGMMQKQHYGYYRWGDVVEMPELPGYNFLYAAKNLMPLDDGWTMPRHDAQIELYYSNNVYRISYELNGGEFLQEPETSYNVGIVHALPAAGTVERAGYGFAGWYDNPELIGEPQTETTVDLAYNITYYAAWEVPVEISTPAQLAALSSDDLGGYYVLTADIDMTGVSFSPIGTAETPFTGSFDGNGYVISGLNILSNANYQGLFGVNAGVVRNVTLAEDCTISGNAYVGGIVGSNSGSIINCISRAEVKGMATMPKLSLKIMAQNLWVGASAAGRGYMIERIRANDPDIICFQEGNVNWINKLTTELTDYTILYKYRAASSLESVPVAFKTDKFDLVDYGHFWLSETPEVESKAQGASHYRICTWAVLKEKSTGQLITAYSVHLDVSGDKVRSLGSQLIKDRMQETISKYPGIMAFAPGDYNCRLGSSPYAIMASDGIVDARYVVNDPPEVETPIDHIMFSEETVKAVDLKVLNETYNGVQPSDHKGLIATVESLTSTYLGGIAGRNTGSIAQSVADGSVKGVSDYGSLIGFNAGEAEDLHYTEQADVPAVGVGTETGTAAGENAIELAHTLNQKAGSDIFTVVNGECVLTNGEEDAKPVCLTVNGTPIYALSGSSLALDTTGFADPICALEGIYFEGTALTVPAHDAAVTITENVTCTEHSYDQCIAIDDATHQVICSANASHVVAGAHQFGEAETVAPGCGTAGYTRQVCADCGYVNIFEEQPALEHFYGPWTYHDTQAHQRVCADDATHMEYAGHTYTETYYPAECENYGYTRFACVCGYFYDVIDSGKLGHLWSALTVKDETYHQQVCLRDERHVLVSEHHWEVCKEVGATCEAGAGTEYTCADCDSTYMAETGDPLGHQYGDWISEGESGHKKVCANDSHHVQAEAHDMDNGTVVPAACEKQGYTRYACADCDYYYDVNFTDALEHQWGEWVEDYPATETEQGQLHRDCTLCDETEYRVLPTAADAAVVADAKVSDSGYLTLTVNLQNNPGLASMQLQLDYDPQLLQIQSTDAFAWGDALSALSRGNGLEAHLNDGSFKTTWVGAANDATSGTLFTLKFKILGDGTVDIGLRVLPGSTNDEECLPVDIYDQDVRVSTHAHAFVWDAECQLYVCRCGATGISNGDVDGDGDWTTADAVLVMQYLIGCPDLEIDLVAADYSKDGRVSIADAVKILRALN